MSEVLLSVAIITYNQEAYISNTIESVLNQVKNLNVEIIIGDDCSTDKTRVILENYRDRFPNIIKPIFNETNMGLIKNYFNVINHCSGKYIMECGGDDYWLPNKVQAQISFMESNPHIDFIYGKGRILKNGKMLNIFWGQEISNLYFGEMVVPMQSSCMKRTIINQYIREENPVEKNWFSEDYPFMIWLSKNANILFINNVNFVYRVLRKSLSHNVKIEKKIENIKCDYAMKLYFAKKYENDNNLVKNIENDCVLSIALVYARLYKYTKCKLVMQEYKTYTNKMKFIKFLYGNVVTFYLLAFRLNLKSQIW